jgi:hypothetical protein
LDELEGLIWNLAGLIRARKRSKAHLTFVASQPCLICKSTPCDAHYLKIARQRSLARNQ